MEGTAFFVGVAVGFIISALLVIIFIPSPVDTWKESYCKHLNGETQGSVCVVDDRVVDVPDYPRSK